MDPEAPTPQVKMLSEGFQTARNKTIMYGKPERSSEDYKGGLAQNYSCLRFFARPFGRVCQGLMHQEFGPAAARGQSTESF